MVIKPPRSPRGNLSQDIAGILIVYPYSVIMNSSHKGNHTAEFDANRDVQDPSPEIQTRDWDKGITSSFSRPLAEESNFTIPREDSEALPMNSHLPLEAESSSSAPIFEYGVTGRLYDSSLYTIDQPVDVQIPPDPAMWPWNDTSSSLTFNPLHSTPISLQLDENFMNLNHPPPILTSSSRRTFPMNNSSTPYARTSEHHQVSKDASDFAKPFPNPLQQQQNRQRPEASSFNGDPSATEDDANAIIGTVSKNGRLQCDHESCNGRSFGRIAELRRHYEGAHALEKPQFWCYEPSCRRSAAAGSYSFSRKDKHDAHVRSMHSHNVYLENNGGGSGLL